MSDLIERAKAAFPLENDRTYFDGHPSIVANELIDALSEAKAENERLTRERDKWFREAEERADACSLLIRERDGLREALKPFAEVDGILVSAAENLRSADHDERRSGAAFRIASGLDEMRKNARAALNPKGGDNGEAA